MLMQQIATILTTFGNNVQSVHQLMQLDSLVLDLVVQHLEHLHERLTAVHGSENSRLNVSNTLAMLRQIRTNDSLERYYREMLNQCNVLLVSYFASAAADIFRAGVTDAVKHGGRPASLKREITIDLHDVREIGGDLVERSGELFLATHREINLQNMQSIAMAFRDYFGYQRKPDEISNDIVLSHACRHVIVHCAGVVDRKMIGQLRSATPRTLKVDVREGQRVQFSEEEIVVVGSTHDYLPTRRGRSAGRVILGCPAEGRNTRNTQNVRPFAQRRPAPGPIDRGLCAFRRHKNGGRRRRLCHAQRD
jgi:hypothetical protein